MSTQVQAPMLTDSEWQAVERLFLVMIKIAGTRKTNKFFRITEVTQVYNESGFAEQLTQECVIDLLERSRMFDVYTTAKLRERRVGLVCNAETRYGVGWNHPTMHRIDRLADHKLLVR